MENTILVEFKITDEENDALQKVYYKKVGLENLLNVNKGDEELTIQYGKACVALADLGTTIIVKYYDKSNEITEKNSWTADFDTNTFTINE